MAEIPLTTLSGVKAVLDRSLSRFPRPVRTAIRGYVSVDGKSQDESAYIRSQAQRGVASGIWKVPRGRYFLLGDNRNDSCDSRTWGSVARSSLIGPVLATYWPPERIRIDH